MVFITTGFDSSAFGICGGDFAVLDQSADDSKK